MSRQATSGQPRTVREITQSGFTFGPNEDYVCIGQGWTIGIVGLPGPSGPPGTQGPNNGDQYTLADPQGIIAGGNEVTVEGNGYKFLSAGVLTTQGIYTSLLFPSAGAALQSCAIKFTFDAASNVWIVEF